MSKCEKRGLSVVEDHQLSLDEVTEKLWKKLGRTEHIFRSIASKERRQEEILKAIEEETGSDSVIDIPDFATEPDQKESVKQYHIVGLAATRLDDSRKKWRFNKVIMGCDNLLTS